MERTNTQQKRRILMNYLYATLIGFLVIACALTIVFVNKENGTIETAEVGTIEVATVTYVVPIKNATIAKDYSASELQYNDTLKQWEIHRAVDFVAGDQTDVYAMTNGTVTKVYNNYLEGNVVEITHSKGLVSVYKSLDSVSVKVGDSVSAGLTIGTAGTTMAQELNTGKHLHFEVLLNGQKVNPNDYVDLSSK